MREEVNSWLRQAKEDLKNCGEGNTTGKWKNLRKSLEDFKKEVSKEIPVKEMILFGSMAKGKKGKDTDIDLIIVSPEFKKWIFSKGGLKCMIIGNSGIL